MLFRAQEIVDTDCSMHKLPMVSAVGCSVALET